jgi:tagatose-1,6-bisphosphate aldolase non-catalytic subunit AgaZ/GatZ
MPVQYQQIINGKIKNAPEEILLDKVGCTLDDYIYAIRG